MKKIFYSFFLLFVLAFFYLNRGNYADFAASLKPCDRPKTYKIGFVDKRFSLSSEALVSDAQEASKIWNGHRPSDLFVYDTNGSLTINFLFDERQSALNKVDSLDDNLNTKKGALDTESSNYQKDSAALSSRLDAFNKTVIRWNAQGGAPKEEYEKLLKEQDELNSEAERLNNIARELNISARSYNSQVSKLNEAISDLNENLERKPEEGIYFADKNVIEIYLVTDKKELIHTLAHEFGHAVGILHSEDENAIMFAYSSKNTELTQNDVAALADACREKTLTQGVLEKYRALISGESEFGFK